MGKILQIRVMADTFDEAEVERRWPRLVGMTWQEPRSDSRKHGVIELLDDLKDKLELGMLSEDAQKNLGEMIRKAHGIKERLQDALGDWRPADASILSFDLEEELDEIELAASA